MSDDQLMLTDAHRVSIRVANGQFFIDLVTVDQRERPVHALCVATMLTPSQVAHWLARHLPELPRQQQVTHDQEPEGLQ